MKRFLLGIFVLVIAIGLGACSKLNPQEAAESTLTFTDFVQNDSIPAEYGRLVSVTTNETYPGWAQLWFEKEDQTIVTVFVKYSNGTMRQKAMVIPRS